MDQSEIAKVKDKGARTALFNAANTALWQAAQATEAARQCSGTEFTQFRTKLEEARAQLDAAELFYDALIEHAKGTRYSPNER